MVVYLDRVFLLNLLVDYLLLLAAAQLSGRMLRRLLVKYTRYLPAFQAKRR